MPKPTYKPIPGWTSLIGYLPDDLPTPPPAIQFTVSRPAAGSEPVGAVWLPVDVAAEINKLLTERKVLKFTVEVVE